MGRAGATLADRQRARRLGAILDNQRKALGWSIRELSDLANVEYETTRAILAGRSVGPSYFLVTALAIALGNDLHALWDHLSPSREAAQPQRTPRTTRPPR